MLKVTKLLNGNTGNQKKKKEKKTLTNTHTHTHTHKNPNKLMLIINKFSKVRGYKFKIQKSVFSTLTMRNLKMNLREKPH